MDKLMKKHPIVTLSVITLAFLLILLGLGHTLPLKPNTSLLVGQIVVTVILLFILKQRGLLYVLKFESKSFWSGMLKGWYVLVVLAFLLIPKLGAVAEAKFTFSAIVIIVIGNLMVGVFEELLTRGLIFNELMKLYTPLKAAIVSGIIFGVAHFFNHLQEPAVSVTSQLIYAFFLGVFFAGIYYVTQNIWSVIVWHGLIDIVSIITAQSSGKVAPPTDLPSIIASGVVPIILTLPMLIMGIRLFKKHKAVK